MDGLTVPGQQVLEMILTNEAEVVITRGYLSAETCGKDKNMETLFKNIMQTAI